MFYCFISVQGLTLYKLFSVKMFAKTALELSVAMPNSRLPTNFQLNVFIFEARVSHQTLLQSLKQNSDKSVKDFLRQIFKLFRLKKYEKTSVI